MVNGNKNRKLVGNVPPSSFLMHMDPPSVPTSPTTTSFRSSSISARPRTVSSPAHAKIPDEVSVRNDDRRDTNHTPFPTSSTSHNDSQSNLNENNRSRRASATASSAYFSIPKTFSISSSFGIFTRRRKSTQHPPPRPPDDVHVLSDVIEIGPEPRRREEGDADVNDEDAELQLLRDAAAQALGLGLGRDSSGTPDPDLEEADDAQATPIVAKSTNPYILAPIPNIAPFSGLTPSPSSLVSLPTSHSQVAPSIVTTAPASTSDTVPPYPCSLSALMPFIQTSSSLFKYHPASTFLALSLNRRAKQWKFRYVVLTSPPPAKSIAHEFLPSTHADFAQRPPNADMLQLRADVLQVPNGDFMQLPSARHSHLHLFKNASPAPEELEIDRLEINEDTVVFVAELEVAGKRDVVKVGGRDARTKAVASAGTSVKSGTGSSWHGSMKLEGEVNVEEMGRTMWFLKMADGPEMQRWIGYIKTAVLVQRAERAGMTFQPHANNGVPNMRADLDVLLSMRSQGLLPSIAVPSRTDTPPYSNHTAPSLYSSQQETSTYSSQTASSLYPKSPSTYNNLPLSPSSATTNTPLPNPNPRYAEHVGAAPSHTTPTSSLRARTYPPPSALNYTLPSLKGLFSPNTSPSSSGSGHGNGPSHSRRGSFSRSGSRPSSPQHDNEKDIDPISDDVVSLGNRAAALLNLFRSSSRASNNHHVNTLNNVTTTTPPPPAAPTARAHGIGAPISPVPYSDETVRGKSSSSGAGHPSAFSVDWSTMNDGAHGTFMNNSNNKQTSGAPSLPPPPRNHRRPATGNGTRPNGVDTAKHDAKPTNGTAHHGGEDLPQKRRSSSPHGPHTPSPTLLSPPTSTPSIQGNNSFRGGRPPSVNSMSSYASAERDRSSEVERGNSIRRSRTVPKMLAPPTGPPPSAPSLRARSPSGPPSPIFEQNNMQRNGSGRLEPSSSAASTTWGSQHPYSKRVSASSAMSVNTASTGHSFLGSKAPPPPRPPPNFAPPPAPIDRQDGASIAASITSSGRESFVPRSLRLSLVPPAAPPTQSLPPRPDEPGYRHRRSNSSEVKSTSSLYPIPASPTPPPFTTHPPAPPPSGPLPPTPDSDRDRPSTRNSRHTSFTRRLRIMSSPSPPSPMQTPPPQKEIARSSSPQPQDTSRHLIGEPILSHSDGYPPMFLNMNDTPVTPAMPHSPVFLLVPSPRQPETDDVEPTSLSPPPRRSSRNSKEIRKDDTKSPVPIGPSLEPQDSAVVLEQR